MYIFKKSLLLNQSNGIAIFSLQNDLDLQFSNFNPIIKSDNFEKLSAYINKVILLDTKIILRGY